MFRKTIAFLIGSISFLSASAQSNLSADKWVDSVFKTLSPDEKIAQLMVVRGSSFDPKTRKPILYTAEVQEQVKKYNIGGICMFQGGPIAQAITPTSCMPLVY